MIDICNPLYEVKICREVHIHVSRRNARHHNVFHGTVYRGIDVSMTTPSKISVFSFNPSVSPLY
jgi:hypothetical protein